jgi:outer membrane protein assembly factor BamB
MGRALRWGCLTLAVALAGVFLVAGLSTDAKPAPSSADRARVRVMNRERILQGRPVGFTRIPGVTQNVAQKDLLGGVSENSVEVVDVVSVSSPTAAGDLLRLAQADSWVTGDQRCDLSREFLLAHRAAAQGPIDQVGFSGAKRLGDFVATLGVTVSPTDGRPTARVELSAPYHAEPDGPVGTRSVPGCIDALTGVGPQGPPIVRTHDVQPGPPTLVGMDLHTGRKRWSKACDPGQLGQTAAAGDVIITSCGETLEALDPGTGHLWWRFDASCRGLGPVLAVDPTDGLAVIASDECHPTLAKDVHSGTQRWAVVPPPISDELMVPLDGGPIMAQRTTISDGINAYWIVRLDPATGQVRWQVDVGTQIDPLAAISGDTLVLGTSTGVVGVDPTGGTTRWSLAFAAPHPRRLIDASGVVVTWSEGGRELVGVDGAIGHLLWRAQATDDIFTVVPGGPNLMVRTVAGIDILDRSTGKTNTHLATAPADTAQLSSGGIAVLGDDTLRWYDTSGLLRFSHPLAGPTRTLSIDPPSGLVLVIDANGQMQAIELTTGATRWTTKTAATAAPPVVISGIVLVRPHG